LPKKILATIYEVERQQFNNLLCRQIKCPEQKEEIQQAVYSLAHWLNGSNTKDQIAARAEFKRCYESIMLQEQKEKMSTNQQPHDIVDVNSSDPMPPETGPEYDNDKIANLSSEIEGWLGEDAKIIKNKHGDKIFISKNGLRRVRFDLKNTKPHNNPHGHVEELVDGTWVKSGPIYPYDIPHN